MITLLFLHLLISKDLNILNSRNKHFRRCRLEWVEALALMISILFQEQILLSLFSRSNLFLLEEEPMLNKMNTNPYKFISMFPTFKENRVLKKVENFHLISINDIY